MPKPELSDPITLRLPLEVLRNLRGSRKLPTDEVVGHGPCPQAVSPGEGKDILAAVEGRKQIASGQSHDMDDVLNEIEIIANGKAA